VIFPEAMQIYGYESILFAPPNQADRGKGVIVF